jgi:hypothetical protein
MTVAAAPAKAAIRDANAERVFKPNEYTTERQEGEPGQFVN